jgi:hypothetical protein
MVKTTINIDDTIYADIVKESVEKYGSTKKISKIVNERLRASRMHTNTGKKRISFTVKEKFANLNADLEIKRGWEDRIKWKH